MKGIFRDSPDMDETQRRLDKARMNAMRYTDEADIWRDAWRIVDPGAANPTAVANNLAKASSFIIHRDGTAAARKHPALRLMCGQLASLFNVDACGGPADIYDRVKSAVHNLDRFPDVCLTCGTFGDFPCRDQHDNAHGGKSNQTDHVNRPHTMERNFTDYSKGLGPRHPEDPS